MDEALYGGSAAHYAIGRMPYPLELAEKMATELGLNGTQQSVDVGCGPGSLTLLLAPLSHEHHGHRCRSSHDRGSPRR